MQWIIILKAGASVITLLYYMGINVAFRISDLLGLKVGDVRNRDKIRRREMKTGKLREMVVLPKLKRVLDEYCMDKERWRILV